MILNIETSTAIVDFIAWLGWKLTSTEVVITDADQTFFRYENDINSGRWQAISSAVGVDVSTDTGLTVGISQRYRLVIHVDADRIPRFYVNGELVYTGLVALTADAVIIPVIGAEVDGGAAATKTLVVRNAFLSQLIGQ